MPETQTVASVRRHAHPEAVEAEWRAQVEQAQKAGIDVTHLDTHMGSALAPEWCDRYVSLGIELGIPVLLTATLGAFGPNNHLAGVGHAPFRAARSAERRPACAPALLRYSRRHRRIRSRRRGGIDGPSPDPQPWCHGSATGSERPAKPRSLCCRSRCGIPLNAKGTRA